MGIQVTITMDDNGQVNVNGPLDNRVLLYGLLETAKDVVQKFNEDNARRVQPATIMPPTKFPGS